uniref:PVC-type heme-binding CxxCH protein n=1 Tax=Shewanella gaetbuli TaxID=220752 RepID=UPI003B59A6B5
MKKKMRLILFLALILPTSLFAKNMDHLVFEAPEGKSNGKHIVLISGDEEYRSEESMPMLAKILSQHHGFKTTVLFAIDKTSGVINPNEIGNIPQLSSLQTADLMILATEWRVLPDEQLKYFLEYLNNAKPIIALRTATHPFKNTNKYGGYDWENFGKNIVGENWLNHHGEHKVQGGRGVINQEYSKHDILTDVQDIFTKSDIYGIEHLNQKEAKVLLYGAVTESLDEASKLVDGSQNDPMMPLAWLKKYPTPKGNKQGDIFATTAGAAVDFEKQDLRRLVVNASYFLLGLKVPKQANVSYVDPYKPSFYGFQVADYFVKRELKVDDFVLGKSGKSILSKEELAARGKTTQVELSGKENIVLIGNGLAERMLHHGHFETEIFARNPEKSLTIRTLAKPGYTPGFRPHSSRNSQWAFPGAEKFNPDYQHHSGEGHHPTSDQWLTSLSADVVIAFFGFSESFKGPEGIENYKGELRGFIDHSLANRYNGKTSPKLVLVSPIAYQNLSDTLDLPSGEDINTNLALYRDVMKEIADEKGVHFVDLFEITKEIFATNKQQLTVNGVHLNDAGYKLVAPLLTDEIFGQSKQVFTKNIELLNKQVLDKNWYWFQVYQMPNGVHVDGRRFEPYGVDNYPKEITKAKQLTANRDQQIWSTLSSKSFDLAKADSKTVTLSPIKTNVDEKQLGKYLYGEDALDTITTPDGYKVDLFASEKEFPNLANPAQMTFDDQGRLWVATLESYPHWRPGDGKPDDKILIYEDTNNDGRADKEIVFADGLNLPIGFEITEYGVYVSQAPNLVLLKDLDGDDKADTYDIILSGFDVHDTHHAIGAFEQDPLGGIIMEEGVFLHTSVETPYGTVRGVNGGFYRFEPRTQKLQRLVQTHIPNPWGVSFDKWGQGFFLATSSPEVYWMTPVEVKTQYGQLTVGTDTIIEPDHRVRPTSGIEFISSRHFPADKQGDFILNNVIGFLGGKQHSLQDAETGYVSKHSVDLYTSTDPNFRPVDVEFASDGTLYFIDWHNQLIGHMQHNARDPLRDHAHGRIYRVSYPKRAFVPDNNMKTATPTELFNYLTWPEDRVRFRARRAIRALDESSLSTAKKAFIESLDKSDENYERYLLEALWASNSLTEFDKDLLKTLLKAEAPQARAAAVRVLRYNLEALPNATALLMDAAGDENGRVRLEVITAVSWLDQEVGVEILTKVGDKPVDDWMKSAFLQTMTNLGGSWEFKEEAAADEAAHLEGDAREIYFAGKTIYRKEGYCATCHQLDGNGLPVAQFPPLSGTTWVTGQPERLIDIALHGIMGRMYVNGKKYDGHVPMTPFKGMLNDEEMAAVLTYVRNAFGNQASIVTPDQVKKVRASEPESTGFWTEESLNKKYPDGDKVEPVEKKKEGFFEIHGHF